jgi:hypothetical protein
LVIYFPADALAAERVKRHPTRKKSLYHTSRGFARMRFVEYIRVRRRVLPMRRQMHFDHLVKMQAV